MAVRPHLSRIVKQVLVEYGFDCRDTGGAGDRIATEGCAMVARDEQVTSGAGQHCPDRYATRKALRHRDDIGYDTIMFPTEELSCAAHASLHLVADHHEVTLVTPLAHALYKLRCSRPDTTFALYCLDQYAHGFFARRFLQCF